jgi:hypothetical protein
MEQMENDEKAVPVANMSFVIRFQSTEYTVATHAAAARERLEKIPGVTTANRYRWHVVYPQPGALPMTSAGSRVIADPRA